MMREIDHYNVLLVDDEYYLRQSLRRRIEEEADDFRIVAEASDGREALKALDEHDIHVVFTDIRMPVMDGLALAEKIHESGRGILMVILTGYAEFEYARKALTYGVTDYLLKPVEPEELSNTLSALRVSLQKYYRLSDENEAGRLGAKESVHQAVRYMQEHYMEEIDIASLADSLGFNSAYLTRLAANYAADNRAMTTVTLERADGRMIMHESIGAFPVIEPEPAPEPETPEEGGEGGEPEGE